MPARRRLEAAAPTVVLSRQGWRKIREAHGYREATPEERSHRCLTCGAEWNPGWGVGLQPIARATERDPHLPDACPLCGGNTDGSPVGRGAGDYVIQIVGTGTAFDGRFLLEHDPMRGGSDPRSGQPLLVRLETTPNVREALRFADASAARREWIRWDGWLRPDGKPSRPFSAFTVEMARADRWL